MTDPGAAILGLLEKESNRAAAELARAQARRKMEAEASYDVICAYDLEWPGSCTNDGHHSRRIATAIPFADAASIMRTLLKRGEPGVDYAMVPADLMQVLDGETNLFLPAQVRQLMLSLRAVLMELLNHHLELDPSDVDDHQLLNDCSELVVRSGVNFPPHPPFVEA